MLNTIKYLYFFLLALIIAGCYKDKGNYDYHAINQVAIGSDSASVTVAQQDTLRINISLSQTMPDAAGLSYEWVLYPANTPLTRRILDSTKELSTVISEAPGSYYLDYFVTDKKTGVSFQKQFTVNVVSAFGEGWLVLEEMNGATDLCLITKGDRIFKDIYSITNKGNKLPAGTDKISVIHNRNDQEIFILSPDDMIQVNYIDFLKMAEFRDLFYTAPAVSQPEAHIMESSDKRLYNNGKVYTISTMVPGPHFYGLPLSGITEHYMEPFSIHSIARGFIYYDRISQKFYKAGSFDIEYSKFPDFDPALDSFDMNNIGKKLLYAERNVTNLHHALFKNNNDDSLFIYVIDAGSSRPATETFDVTNVPGLLHADHFRMSRTLSYLYYSNQNKVYKLDILAQTSTLLYTFPAGAQVADIQMYFNRKDGADPENNRLLAIAANEAGEGKVYLFPIAATGNFEGDTYRSVYGGFKQINGIAFKSMK